MSESPRCPECGSPSIYRDGWRRLSDGSAVQRYLCRVCGYRFTEKRFDRGVQGNRSNSLKDGSTLELICRAYAPAPDREVWMKDGQQVGEAAGAAVKGDEAWIEGKIIEFLWWMKKNGYKESTIVSRGSRLRRLVKLGADLLDPESVKETIAKQGWSESRKESMVYAYDLFARWMGIRWEKPSYKPPRKLPFIPLEREIDDLIAGCSSCIAAFLQIAKETGARAGEIYRLRWTDIDFENRTIRITAEKGGEPRIFRISSKLVGMLQAIPKNSEMVFSRYKNLGNLRRTFNRYRRRIAYRLGNPRLLQITFHTLRHWKATMEYAKTKDILHVMQVLGHRNIKNTLIYTQLVKNTGGDEYICKVARSPAEIQELIEAGFEYVCQKDDLVFFRKRK